MIFVFKQNLFKNQFSDKVPPKFGFGRFGISKFGGIRLIKFLPKQDLFKIQLKFVPKEDLYTKKLDFI